MNGTNSNSTNNNSPAQSQMNVNDIYGLGVATDCIGGGCVQKAVSDLATDIPSLQEIASYNQSVISGQSPAKEYSDLNQAPGVREVETLDRTQQPLPQDTLQTPATTIHGATLDNGIRNDMGMQITDFTNPYPVTAESIQYLNGFIRTQIGRRVTIDFLVGSNNIVEKSGYLLGVAANYILLNELDTNDITTCDFYNIKFIRFYY